MRPLVDFFSGSPTILALANFFAILAGVVFFWNVIKFGFKIILSIYNNKIIQYLKSLKLISMREYINSARDLHIFLSRYLILISNIILSTTGLIIVSLSSGYEKTYIRNDYYQIFIIGRMSFKQIRFLLDSFTGMIMLTIFIFSGFLVLEYSRGVRVVRMRCRKRGRLK